MNPKAERISRHGNHTVQRRVVEILVVEGTSEKIYFERLGKIADIPIHPIDCKGGDIPKIRRVCENELSKMRKGDTFGIVMDVDNTPLADIREFDGWCKKKNIRLYISNPSYEVFLLMHYTDARSSLDQDSLEESLSHQIGTRYDKAKGIRLTKTMVSDAIHRGKRTIADPSTGLENCLSKPGTTMVHLLVERLMGGSG